MYLCQTHPCFYFYFLFLLLLVWEIKTFLSFDLNFVLKDTESKVIHL